MTSNLRKRPTARNPRTLAKFRRDTWWQITFPMLMVILILIGLVVGLGLWQGNNGIAVVADYSLVLLILPMLLAGLMAIGLLIALIYGLLVLMKWLPPYTYIAHQKAFDVRDWTVKIANSITGVIISIRAAFDGFWRFLQHRGFIPSAGDDPASTTTERQP